MCRPLELPPLRRAGAAKAVRIASLAHLTDIHATFLSLGGYEATDADRPLVDGTPPVLRLVSFVSDNVFDPKLAVPGDRLRLTFEANELVSAPTVTAGSATATVSPLHRAGVAARGFPRPKDPATYAAAWVAEVTVTDCLLYTSPSPRD